MKFITVLSCFFMAFSVLANDKYLKSFYTSVKIDDCIDLINIDKGLEDSFNTMCAGISGYDVFINGGDLRYSLDLLYYGKPLESGRLVHEERFHNMGSDKIEWRFDILSALKH